MGQTGLFDYQTISRALSVIRTAVDNAMEELEISSECGDYVGEIEVKRQELREVYGELTQNLGTFLEDLNKQRSIIGDMKYGFREEDLQPGGAIKHCIFPSEEIRRFIEKVNKVDGEIFRSFKDLGDMKLDLVKIAKVCEKPDGQSRLRRRLEQMDSEIGALIDSKVFFDHPLDEVEDVLPVDLMPEDKKFVELLVDCTTQFPEKLLQNLRNLRDVGRPYDFG